MRKADFSDEKSRNERDFLNIMWKEAPEIRDVRRRIKRI